MTGKVRQRSMTVSAQESQNLHYINRWKNFKTEPLILEVGSSFLFYEEDLTFKPKKVMIKSLISASLTKLRKNVKNDVLQRLIVDSSINIESISKFSFAMPLY